ncbi:MAG: outer membrane protein assembly factor BamA [Gammaproteobacteria bacterium]|jgi:outer membrane protein insertion porin family|nr:outer membrane protein assembly factor BamA [Gammaproteobacteria bacterium]
MKYRYWLLVALLFTPALVQAFDNFVVEDIKIEGLQRIALGTAFTYLPLKVGEELTAKKASEAVRALFKTGFFENVSLGREGNVLVIVVEERPSIASIEIFGNEEINTDDLMEALKGIGMAEGRVFNRSLLDQVEQELHRQYFNLGKYGVEIKSTITDLPRNRVDIDIDIEEGDAARIRQINIIGAKHFKDYDLITRFQLSQGTMFSFISGSDKYSKQQLIGDLETLRSFYLDRGYIHFDIESTQVSISPDKRDVYITINIKEGEQFTVKDFDLSGDMVVPKEELRELVLLEPGDVFSRQLLVQSTNKINDRLGVEGYAFANVNAIPKIDDEKKEVSITFFVDPGKRVYVRRINITGNTKTKDEVIRREMRQMEGGWISTPLINRSKIRLQRLGFFDNVNVETPAVPGTTDQVDVNFSVVEGSTGNFSAGIGYGQEGGFLFNTSVTLNNYLGTGKRVKLEVNNDRINKIYSFSYQNPYFTMNEISSGIRLLYRSTDAAQANLSDFYTDVKEGGLNFGIPISEFTRLNFDVSYKDTDLSLGASAPRSYREWVKLVSGEGIDTARFKTYSTEASYSYDSRNRAIFPDRGLYSRIGAEVALPGGDLEYYRLSYQLRFYVPFSDQVSLLLGGEYGYGDGYGEEGTGKAILPFFENFYAGGTRSVRGYKGNTIGPRDAYCPNDDLICANPVRGDPVGGNEKILGRAELYFPVPFTDEPSRNFRLSMFVDTGRLDSNVPFVINDNDFRTTYGVAAVWITPVGALVFNWAWPIDPKEGDEIERFQFNIGAPF